MPKKENALSTWEKKEIQTAYKGRKEEQSCRQVRKDKDAMKNKGTNNKDGQCHKSEEEDEKED